MPSLDQIRTIPCRPCGATGTLQCDAERATCPECEGSCREKLECDHCYEFVRCDPIAFRDADDGQVYACSVACAIAEGLPFESELHRFAVLYATAIAAGLDRRTAANAAGSAYAAGSGAMAPAVSS